MTAFLLMSCLKYTMLLNSVKAYTVKYCFPIVDMIASQTSRTMSDIVVLPALNK